jgi:2',3'-cyclic-nucleotide 2'-phosphodiesterase (5'-nucleotidase family)
VVDWCQPTLMLRFQGVKIGVIGIITPATAKMSFPDNVAGLEFLPMAETIATYRDRLREQGADLIFLAIHEGLPYDPEAGWRNIAEADETAIRSESSGAYGSNYSYGGMNLMELVNAVSGIDFAVGGHTHRGYPEPWIDPVNHTLCFETYGNGSSVGHVILEIDRATRTLVGYDVPHDRGTLVTLFEDELWPDREIGEVIQPWHEETEAELEKVVGRAAANFTRGSAGSNEVGFLVTDAMREHFDADFAFQNLGGLRADISAGPITARDIFAVLPFGNELVVVEMDGRTIRRIIERKLGGSGSGIVVSGARVVYDLERPEWDRVVELEVGGAPWDPDRIYAAVCTNFLMEGNSGLDFLTTIPAARVTPTQVTTAEAVERYLELHSPVSPANDGRWIERRGQKQAVYLQVDYLP